jgi:hypothetical protein
MFQNIRFCILRSGGSGIHLGGGKKFLPNALIDTTLWYTAGGLTSPGCQETTGPLQASIRSEFAFPFFKPWGSDWIAGAAPSV